MTAKDIHKNPFSQETITKLDIFEAYVREWLPVFIQYPNFNEVNICDFFAGEGRDPAGNLGSPLRILKVIQEYKNSIIEKQIKINVIFNELKKNKFTAMKSAVEKELLSLNMNNQLNVEFYNDEFQKLFRSKANKIKKMPNLIFLDQYGIKQITQEVFATIENFSRTDFMFFIASSYFNRFMDTKEFKNYFPDLDIGKIKDIKYKDSHRFIINYYRSKLPDYSKTRLYPFTIRKTQNIYGLIFGSKNVLGIQKFLEVAWDKNRINGEANFDIDEDIENQQAVLFPEMKKKTKIEIFQDDLKNYILSLKTVTNRQIYDYTLNNGFLPSHASEYIRKLKRENVIKFKGHSKISYDKCYRNPEKVKFEVV